MADELPDPPAVERVDRVQLNTKLRTDLNTRTRTFGEAKRTTLQAVIEAALAEYLDRRGWTDEKARQHQRRHG